MSKATFTHVHHIVPRHMGGTDDPSNLVELTVEEHAEAHRILYEKYGHWEDKIAWEGLSGQITKQEAIKKLLSEAGKRGGSKHNGSARHTKPHSQIAKLKISLNNKQKKAIHTPHGIFESKTAYAKYIGISENTLRTIYNKTLDKPIDSRGKHTLFGKENIGKTPRELGYYYV
jgi:hypothetical protein